MVRNKPKPRQEPQMSSRVSEQTMNRSSFRDLLLKDRPGEELGQRSEALISQGLGFLATLMAALAFQSPIVIIASVVTNLVAVFTLIQAVRGKFNFLILFPYVTSFSICIVAIVEGKGSHDLIWAGTLGLFLLANIYSRRNMWVAVALGALMLVMFSATALAEMTGVLPNPYGTNMEHVLLGLLYLSSIMGAIAAVFHRQHSLLVESVARRQEELEAKKNLESLNSMLDRQVRERTQELEKINRDLIVKTARIQAASEISQDLANHLNSPTRELLHRATRLVSEKLGYYHVGIFLVDAVRGFAVLNAANSRGGQEMLSRHHQLKVGGAGIVGYVAQSGRSRIALDTGADAVFFNNPFLPETRSEIALPIKFVNTIVGVLDVQSTQSAAFNEEDANVLMTVANQLGIILSRKDEEAIAAQSSKRSTRMSTRNWQSGYAFRSDGSIATLDNPVVNPALERAMAAGETVAISRPPKGNLPLLAVPVKYREHVIGIIQIESDDANRGWTEDEIQLVQAISDRAALALENARLFEDATRRAEQEQTIQHVTTQIGASTDFERIMQTTIQELGVALGASRSFIQIGTPPVDEGTLT